MKYAWMEWGSLDREGQDRAAEIGLVVVGLGSYSSSSCSGISERKMKDGNEDCNLDFCSSFFIFAWLSLSDCDLLIWFYCD